MSNATIPEPQSASSSSPVTTIFARRVRPGSEERYEEWLAGISRSSSGFAGNQGTTILRPGEGRDDYIAITQFDGEDTLEIWLRSTKRGEWLEKLQEIDICREEVLSMAGMERWFTLPNQGANRMPPRYKTAVLVFLGLYPLVLMLDTLLGPSLAGLPKPVQVLISLLISVPMMVWIVLPLLTRVLFRWLHPSPSGGAS
ncbi:MAG: antibiotic biosynthesis monooxygenase (ABM) superfamily enzyme [Planctomycetota bacterium]